MLLDEKNKLEDLINKVIEERFIAELKELEIKNSVARGKVNKFQFGLDGSNLDRNSEEYHRTYKELWDEYDKANLKLGTCVEFAEKVLNKRVWIYWNGEIEIKNEGEN